METNNEIGLIVVGNPSVGNDILIYLAEHNIPLVNIEDLKPDDNPKKVLVINSETKLSDVIRVINMETAEPFIISPPPVFEEPYVDLKDLDKPFYADLYGKKGGKKNRKRFGR